MLVYNYECGDCGHSLEISQGIKEKPLKKCPECKKMKLERVILSAPLVFVSQDPKTIRQLADRNTKKMGRYELEEKTRKAKIEKYHKREADQAKLEGRTFEEPYHEKVDKKLANLTPEQKTEYILTGKKPNGPTSG